MIRKDKRKIKNLSKKKKQRRKLSIRRKVDGSTERPRLCVVKTNKHIQVQVVDDSIGKTLFAVQTYGKNKIGTSANKESAKLIGAAVAGKLKATKIETAVFDRNGSVYTGVIAAVADAVRENGIRV
jgi:large subunit ribosomal protein L18